MLTTPILVHNSEPPITDRPNRQPLYHAPPTEISEIIHRNYKGKESLRAPNVPPLLLFPGLAVLLRNEKDPLQTPKFNSAINIITRHKRYFISRIDLNSNHIQFYFLIQMYNFHPQGANSSKSKSN